MKSLRNMAVLATMAFLCAAACADVVGKWSGKMEVEFDKATKAKMGNQTPKMPTLELELKADKTYKGVQSVDSQTNTAEGTWVLEGNQLKLTPKKRNGKPATGEGAKTRVYQLSKDGKTLTLDLSAQFRSAVQSSGAKEVPQVKAKMVLRKK